MTKADLVEQVAEAIGPGITKKGLRIGRGRSPERGQAGSRER